MKAILTDLDRTLTGEDLLLGDDVRARLRELREGGVPVLVVSGRTLPHMLAMGLDKECAGIVAENGAIVCLPQRQVYEVLDPHFAEKAQKALGPMKDAFTWGRVLASGRREIAQEASARLTAAGVAHTLSFNAEEVMILPKGVDKAAGATRALSHLGIKASSVAAIGDGENDVPLLRMAKLSAAPLNAAAEAAKVADVNLTGAYEQGFLMFSQVILSGARRRSRGAAATTAGMV